MVKVRNLFEKCLKHEFKGHAALKVQQGAAQMKGSIGIIILISFFANGCERSLLCDARLRKAFGDRQSPEGN